MRLKAPYKKSESPYESSHELSKKKRLSCFFNPNNVFFGVIYISNGRLI